MSIIGWKQIYTHTVTGAAETSITIPNLHGDTDFEYRLEARIVNGYNGTMTALLLPNNDTTATNYGRQYVRGLNTTPSAARANASYNIAASDNLGEITQTTVKIQAKSGYVRTMIYENTALISGTTVGLVTLAGNSWNNTADEITSLVVLADQTDGLGIGSSFSLSVRATMATTAPTVPIEWV